MGVAWRLDRWPHPLAGRPRAATILVYPLPTETEMPNGTHPNRQPDLNSNRPTKPLGLGVRVRTRWRRARLDDELARGASPTANAELTLRATQLSSPVMRSRLVGELLRRLHDARLPQPDAIKVRWAQRAEIRDCADDLLALALRLGDRQHVDARGAAMTARLLSDKTSPLNQDDGHNLRSALRAARLALDATDLTAEDLPAAA